MNQDDFSLLLSAYLDGEVTAAERAEVERQLEASADARRQLTELRQLSGLVRELPTPPMPLELGPAIIQQLERHTLLAADAAIATPGGVGNGHVVAALRPSAGSATPTTLPTAAVPAATLTTAGSTTATSPQPAAVRGWHREWMVVSGGLLTTVAALVMMLQVMEHSTEFPGVDHGSMATSERSWGVIGTAPMMARNEMPRGETVAQRSAAPAMGRFSQSVDTKDSFAKMQAPAAPAGVVADGRQSNLGLAPAPARSLHRDEYPLLSEREGLSDSPPPESAAKLEQLERRKRTGPLDSLGGGMGGVGGGTGAGGAMGPNQYFDEFAPQQDEEETVAAFGRSLPQATNFANCSIGDVVPYLANDGTNVAVVEVTVVDIDRAAAQCQVLLRRNRVTIQADDINPHNEESSVAAKPDTTPPADKQREGAEKRIANVKQSLNDLANQGELICLYVDAPAAQLANAWREMEQHQLFAAVKLQPPVKAVEGLAIADEVSNPEGNAAKFEVKETPPPAGRDPLAKKDAPAAEAQLESTRARNNQSVYVVNEMEAIKRQLVDREVARNWAYGEGRVDENTVELNAEHDLGASTSMARSATAPAPATAAVGADQPAPGSSARGSQPLPKASVGASQNLAQGQRIEPPLTAGEPLNFNLQNSMNQARRTANSSQVLRIAPQEYGYAPSRVGDEFSQYSIQNGPIHNGTANFDDGLRNSPLPPNQAHRGQQRKLAAIDSQTENYNRTPIGSSLSAGVRGNGRTYQATQQVEEGAVRMVILFHTLQTPAAPATAPTEPPAEK